VSTDCSSTPLAAALAGDEGFAALDRHNAARAVGEVVANPTLAIRTRFFDDLQLAEAGARLVRQVVIVAAGLDTRAFRLCGLLKRTCTILSSHKSRCQGGASSVTVSYREGKWFESAAPQAR
jgi:Leucine carboxyl methyltransferase